MFESRLFFVDKLIGMGARIVLAGIRPEVAQAIVSLGVVIAILNAVIAIVLSYGRIFFSSGRDRAWPGSMNGWMDTTSGCDAIWLRRPAGMRTMTFT